ncbi:MAG: hypothetical protein CMA54_01130 [Euryarchaeota archaeon]|nr:hypothetical protein [Euryarchaeota archaeon]
MSLLPIPEVVGVGGMEVKEGSRAHQLSPSSWNRFEECPRKYWLSRKGLPRKASMPASLGTAIHNSVEDLCNLDLSGRNDDEAGWFPPPAKTVLDRHWQVERDIFLETPRHPRWKSELITKAHDGLVGALNILFSKAHIPPPNPPKSLSALGGKCRRLS